jgi:uncharacterized protein
MVFDASTVVSALVFRTSGLSWLRTHWRESACVPLISRATAAELVKVLAYPKFNLSTEDQREFLSDYLPYCEAISVKRKCPLACRDARDQPFLDLAQCGNAASLVSGDKDLLALAGRTRFLIESPEAYRRRVRNDQDPIGGGSSPVVS